MITGDYSDIQDDIIRYQLSTGVIVTKADVGAGYF
jgi:hypothetical protein